MIKPSDSQLLNRAECNVLRGIAILGIVLHNYTHWLRPMVKENEYTFKQGNADRMAELLSQPDWYLPAQLLSFFGHSGVPIFLFLSAFGLVMKYEQKMPATPVPPTGKEESAWSFLRQHFLKLFKLMLTGFVIFVLVDGMTPRLHHYHLLDVVAQLGMFNNLLPHPERVIWPGPYWFFGLMMQLYVIYRLLLYRRSSWWVLCLMLVCTAVQMFFSPAGEELNYLRYNFVGGVLPFGLGLLFARHGRMPTQKAYYCIVLVVALLLIFLMGFHPVIDDIILDCIGYCLINLLFGSLLKCLSESVSDIFDNVLFKGFPVKLFFHRIRHLHSPSSLHRLSLSHR